MLILFVVAVVEDETGAALVQPPKSSSAATARAGLEPADADGAPQPAPMSLAVRVSGIFIIEEVAGAVAGAGSGVFHALPPPQGSMLAGRALAMDAVVADTLDLGAGAETGAGAGELRLKAAFNSCCGEVADDASGDDTLAEETGAGEDSPKRSLDNEEDGGGGFGLDGGDAKLVNPESKPLDEIEVVRD